MWKCKYLVTVKSLSHVQKIPRIFLVGWLTVCVSACQEMDPLLYLSLRKQEEILAQNPQHVSHQDPATSTSHLTGNVIKKGEITVWKCEWELLQKQKKSCDTQRALRGLSDFKRMNLKCLVKSLIAPPTTHNAQRERGLLQHEWLCSALICSVLPCTDKTSHRAETALLNVNTWCWVRLGSSDLGCDRLLAVCVTDRSIWLRLNHCLENGKTEGHP